MSIPGSVCLFLLYISIQSLGFKSTHFSKCSYYFCLVIQGSPCSHLFVPFHTRISLFTCVSTYSHQFFTYSQLSVCVHTFLQTHTWFHSFNLLTSVSLFLFTPGHSTSRCSSVAALTECMRNKSLAKFFRERQASLKRSLPLGSYLLKPVQRILKYHLLLQVRPQHTWVTSLPTEVRTAGDGWIH